MANMKTRGSCVKSFKIAGVVALVSGLWLLATFRSPGKHAAKAEVSAAAARPASSSAGKNQDSKWLEAYGRLPLSFEENAGQTAHEVRYVSHGAGYELFLTPQEAVLSLPDPATYDLSPLHRFKTLQALHAASRARMMTVVRMGFEGANSAPLISATDRLVKKTNYFIGNDPTKWRTGVASYARVKYADLYPGVDMVFYGNQRRLEYDFVVAPGADPKNIRLKIQGARRLHINTRGDVVLSVARGELVLQKPVVYQMLKGERHEIGGGYVLTERNRVMFSVPDYDRSEPLILDPVLNYSTYLGGSLGTTTIPPGTGIDQGFGIAVDSTGNAFVAGTTFSTNFPTTANAYTPGPVASNPFGAVFVTEMNPTGTAEIYSTYLTGSTGDVATALALDSSGKIYVTGQSFSSDFPTTSNAFKQSPNPTNTNVGTSFVSKIDPTLSSTASLVYSSYIGGTTGDFGNGIAVDASGNAYVTGITSSPAGSGGTLNSLTTFPVLNAFQAAPTNSARGNAFLTRIDTTKSGNASLIYSTYLGGAGANATMTGSLGFADQGFGVAVDSSSNAYIVGATTSTDFPTNGTLAANQAVSPPGNTKGTAFVSRIDTTKSGSASLAYSTYLGGQTQDLGLGIALGPNNVAYATGTTRSTNFPTMPAGAFQTTNKAIGGVGTAFVTLIDTGVAGGASLKYSTYLGGTSTDVGNSIRADGAGNAYVVGATGSSSFPITAGALQPVYPGGQSDGFVSKLNPAGAGASDLLYSTFFGGNGPDHDQIFAAALDTATPPNVFITGETFSGPTPAGKFPIFPNPGAFQTTLKGTADAFIAKLTLIPTLVVSPTSLNFGTIVIPNTSPAKTVTLTNNTNAAIAFTSAVVNGNPAAANTDYAATNSCSGSIPAGATNTCTVSVTFKPTVVGAETATLQLTDSDSTSPQTISLTGAGSNTPPDFTLGVAPATATVTNGSSATYTVTVTPTGGFSSAVAITCAEPPALTLSTCTPVPASITAPQTSTVTVTTTAFMVPPSLRTPPISIRQIVPLLVALMLLCLLPRTRRLPMRLALATAMIFFIVLAGCGGKPHPHTDKGSYTLTITGTAGALTHSQTVTLVVN
jgi:hypothetical protein